MNNPKERKAKVKEILLAYLRQPNPNDISTPYREVAKVKEQVAKRIAEWEGRSSTYEDALNREDDKVFNEVFWDLFLEKVITLDTDFGSAMQSGSKPPRLRLHSEAVLN